MSEDGELTDIEHIDLEEFDGMNDAQIEESLRRRAFAMKPEVLSNFLYGVAATGDEEQEDMVFDYLDPANANPKGRARQQPRPASRRDVSCVRTWSMSMSTRS